MNPEEGRPAEREDYAHDQLRQMLTEDEVLALTKMSRSSLHRLEKAKKFPPCVYPSPNMKRYYEDTIIGWQKALDKQDQRNPNRGRGKGRRPRQRVSASPT